MTTASEIPAPLRREVRHLGALLGHVIEEAEGVELFEDVERLRRATIALRREPTEARRRHALDLVAALDPSRAERVARAFTIYFQLVNLAEEHHRVRALSERGRSDEPVPDSVAAAVRSIRERQGEEGIRTALDRLEITPVLTAHPTEARRRAVVESLWRVEALLERFDDPRLSRGEEDELDRRLIEEITTLWHTDPLRSRAPDPLDEVRAAMALFDQTLFVAIPALLREVDRALDGRSGRRPPACRPFVRWGSWIGGDRDGNPNVTAEVTRAAAGIGSEHVLRGLEAATRRIARAVALSDGNAPPIEELRDSLADDERRFPRAAAEVAGKFPDASHRRKLVVIAQRLLATRTGDAEGYRDPAELLSELRMVQRSLAEAGAVRVAYGELQHLVWQAETFGFHLASLEVRQHAEVHAAALRELLPDAAGDGRALDEIAFGGSPPAATPTTGATAEVLEAFRAMADIQRRLGPDACRRCIVSFTRTPADVVGVHALARLSGAEPELDVVPLFESREDLERATRVLDELVGLPGMRSWLASRDHRLEVMLGYSDSAKDAGVFAASLALHRAQGELAAWAAANGIELTLFHGRGGALGRGGGPANRAILGQASASVAGRFKITEQGEVTFARYGNRRIAIRHLEQVTNAVLLASTPEHERRAAANWERFGATATRAAGASERAYRSLVEREGFPEFFARTTPADEIGELRIGSRPARRSESEDLDDLRAIPWVFAWTQNRCNLPGWYGLGSGLAAVAEEDGGLDELREMHRTWGFFTSFVENAELSLAKADLPVAQLYLELGERPEIAAEIEREFALTERMVLEVSGHDRPLSNRQILRRAIDLRNPYVDALSFLQVRFLAERRAGGLDPEREAQVDRLVKVTINGVAAGLQNTG